MGLPVAVYSDSVVGELYRREEINEIGNNGILANFRCDCYCRKSVDTEKRERIVDFEVGVLATHNRTELRWLWKSMVVPKPTHNRIQWMQNLWVLGHRRQVMSFATGFCGIDFDE